MIGCLLQDCPTHQDQRAAVYPLPLHTHTHTHTHTHQPFDSSSGSGSIGYQHLYCYYYRHNDYIMSSLFMTCRKVLPSLVIYSGTRSVAITRIASITSRTVDRWTWHDSWPTLPQWRLTCLGRPPDYTLALTCDSHLRTRGTHSFMGDIIYACRHI